ncbi:MAG: ATP synthase F1 subunit delta [Verrucomicrobia bacterium]|nr:ATP synthase F1 subunit delta [Verrucomicrobiota bacterium]MDA1085870.1 ATP synthase F1 subunit delta [Verrucomicrobiota bacterium]
MADSRAGKRYARALFSLATDDQVVDRVLEDLRGLRALIAQSEDLRRFVQHPALPDEKQKDVMKAMFGGRVAPLTERFLQFLVDRRRLALLVDICEVYEDLYCVARNIQRISIEYSHSLRDDQVRAIEAKMGARYGKDIETTTVHEASLLGGFRVRVGDVVHDFSVRGKLDGLRVALTT